VILDGWLDLALVLAAGLAAGLVNVVVGSGTLITFPTLLALGYPPVTANVSNTVGLVPASLAGVVGYRRELVGQGPRLVRLGIASVIGGVAGTVLLLQAPSEVFTVAVPVLVAVACVLVALQPWLSRRLATRDANRIEAGEIVRPPPAHGSLLLLVLIALTGVYGGYFGAAQGAILIAIMGVGLAEHLQRLNAIKNALVLLINGVAGVIFAVIAPISWEAAGLVAAGSLLGGVIGARIGPRLPPAVLRGAILAVGAVTVVFLLLDL